MTCRIDRVTVEHDRIVLRVSGRIASEGVDIFRVALEQESGVVAIDLAEVALVDRAAVTLLATTEANGIELKNCPAYIREWIARERNSS